VTRPFNTRQLRFYLTAPAPCPYLPGKRERKVFTSLETDDAAGLNESLTQAGFRRSQNIAYRPACEGCDACISARIPVKRFAFTKAWRRIETRNADLTATLRTGRATEEQFWLLKTYLAGRHAEGGMNEMTAYDFAAMVEETTVRTNVMEYRDGRGALVGCTLIDLLADGVSLVYSFFDPNQDRRSLGTHMILHNVRHVREAGLDHVYLGYWVRGSEKMAYKSRFRPLELLVAGGWVDYASWNGEREEE
jgi:leucyl-tRNA---protein transferase